MTAVVATRDETRAFAQAATWTERREFYPQGVASGDPAPDSVILWTRLQPKSGDPREQHLIVLELARDREFKKIETRASIPITAETDWTCRFYAAGLKPSTEYWYRFTDEDGNGSRVLEMPHRSRTTSQQHITEPAVLPSEIEQLPDLTGFFKSAGSRCWLRASTSAPFRGDAQG